MNFFPSSKDLEKHRRQCAALVQLLNKIKPSLENELINEILTIFFCQDVSLHQSVVDWLSGCCDRKTAIDVVGAAIGKTRHPFKHFVSTDGRNILGCLSDGGESGDIDDEIMEVPYCHPGDEIHGTL
jgi:hypothetical protein